MASHLRKQSQDKNASMKPNKSLTLAMVLCTLSSSLITKAESLDDTFAWLKRFKAGEDLKIDIRVEGDSFIIFHDQLSKIDAETFKSLAADAEEKGLPRLRLTADADIIVMNGKGRTEIEKHIDRSTQKVTEHVKREWLPIAKFALGKWPAFIRGAVGHGLIRMDEVTFHGQVVLSLYFQQDGPTEFSSGGRTVRFSEGFSSLMRVSSKYKPRPGGNGMVILVHEPHENINGQFQLVPGLKALADANPNSGFSFLVEGDYTAEQREIGFNSLDVKLDAARGAAPAEPLVYRLLANHMIDGPMAYRLLYDRSLPAIAIDDRKYLATKSYGEQPANLQEERKVLGNIAGVASSLPKTPETEEVRQEVLGFLVETIAFSMADKDEFSGPLVVEYLTTMADRFDKIADVIDLLMKALPSSNLSNEKAFLTKQSKAYKGEAAIYADAIKRNSIMAQLIIKNAKTTTSQIPVAFIGSFHTEGIAEELSKANVGYVVIEPRHSNPSSGQEKARFDSFLYSESRKEAFESMLKLRKGQVAPTAEEVNDYITPYLEKNANPIAGREEIARRAFLKQKKRRLDFDALRQTVRSNGALAEASIEFGSGKMPPNVPPEFRSAFAFFEPSGGGGAGGGRRGGRLFIADAGDSGWSDRARHNFFRDHVMTPPSDDKGIVWRRKSQIHQDRETQRLYASVYDAATQKFYLFDGDVAWSVMTQIQLPKPKKGEDVLIRLQLTELFNRTFRQHNG